MGLLTKYVLFAQLIVLILFILPVLVFRGIIPSDSIYASYTMGIVNIALLIVMEIIIILAYNRNSIITSVSNSIKKSANTSLQTQMQEQNRINPQSRMQNKLSSVFNNWVAPSQSLESIQITPGLISQINGVIDHVTKDIIKLV